MFTLQHTSLTFQTYLQDAELTAAVDKKNTAIASANRHVVKIRGLVEEAKARTAELSQCRAELARVQEELQVGGRWGGGYDAGAVECCVRSNRQGAGGAVGTVGRSREQGSIKERAGVESIRCGHSYTLVRMCETSTR